MFLPFPVPSCPVLSACLFVNDQVERHHHFVGGVFPYENENATPFLILPDFVTDNLVLISIPRFLSSNRRNVFWFVVSASDASDSYLGLVFQGSRSLLSVCLRTLLSVRWSLSADPAQ